MGNKTASSDATFIKLITLKGAIKFFCLFVLVFGLLMGPWPRLGRAYRTIYIAGASFLFGSIRPTGTAVFEPLPDSENDMTVTLCNRARPAPDGDITRIQTHHSSRHAGYMYVAFLSALILATPIPLGRKVWAMFSGMILLHGLVALQLALRIFHAFHNRPLSMFAMSTLSKRVLSIAHQAFAVNVTFGFVVSVFIWFLVCFRRKDWAMIISKRKKREK